MKDFDPWKRIFFTHSKSMSHYFTFTTGTEHNISQRLTCIIEPSQELLNCFTKPMPHHASGCIDQKLFMKKENQYFFTLRRRRLAGLVGDGLGDFPDRGVDSWLPAVPLAVNERIKSATAMAAAVVASSALDRVQRAETHANTHPNCWTRGTCSCETSRHTAARSDPAETAGGRMTQTLPPCTLEVDGRRTLSHFYCAEA